MDSQYSYYVSLYFTGCGNDEYTTYTSEKENADYYPQSGIRCKMNHWNKYINDVCPVHFIDKKYY